MRRPSVGKLETRLHADGYEFFVGVDEVGRGCLAGPVHAGAVAFAAERLRRTPPKALRTIRDSKQLSAIQRQKAHSIISGIAWARSVASASVAEIESLGIVGATFLAMRRALSGVTVAIPSEKKSILLVDGAHRLPEYLGEQLSVVDGDAMCWSIAAASILAKETRDGEMRLLSAQYPGYGFESHVGYGTPQHLDSLRRLGISPLHRRNFSPIRELIHAPPRAG